MKRRVRSGIEIGLPLLGMGIIFGSVLFASPGNLPLQLIPLLVGVLILEAGLWALSGILPTERRYTALREEGDHFIGLIRGLNAAAVARDKGHEDDQRFRDTLEQMHTSVEGMAELAGQDALPRPNA